MFSIHLASTAVESEFVALSPLVLEVIRLQYETMNILRYLQGIQVCSVL